MLLTYITPAPCVGRSFLSLSKGAVNNREEIGREVGRGGIAMRFAVQLVGFACLGLAVVPAPALATVTFGNATLEATASVPPKPDARHLSTANTLSAANLSEDQQNAAGSKSARSAGSVTFADAERGQFDLSNVRSFATNTEVVRSASAFLDFNYTFVVDQAFL